MDPFDYGNQHVISSKTVGHVGITFIACWPPPPTFWNIFRVVDLTRKIQAAKPWFHQYLDPYHLWRRGQTSATSKSPGRFALLWHISLATRQGPGGNHNNLLSHFGP